MKRLVLFLLQTVLVGLAAAFVLVWVKPELLTSTGSAGQVASAGSAVRSYADAVNRTAPSVVSIYTRTMVSEPMIREDGDVLFRQLFGNRRVMRPRSGLGSGVIVSPNGVILTTAHVIDGVDNIFVSLFDGRVAEARIIGTDPGTDLAVLKVELEGLPAALRAAGGDGDDLEQTRALAHKTAGSAAVLGATAIQDVLSTLEDACADEEAEFVAPLTAELERLTPATVAALRSAIRENATL